MKRFRKGLALFIAVIIPLMLFSSCIEKSAWYNGQKLDPTQKIEIKPGEYKEVTFEIKPKSDEISNGRYVIKETLNDVPEGFDVYLLSLESSDMGAVRYSTGKKEGGGEIFEGNITVSSKEKETFSQNVDISQQYIRYTLKIQNNQNKLYESGQMGIDVLFGHDYSITTTTEVGHSLGEPETTAPLEVTKTSEVTAQQESASQTQTTAQTETITQSGSDKQSECTPQSGSDKHQDGTPQSGSDKQQDGTPQSGSDKQQDGTPQSGSDKQQDGTPQSGSDKQQDGTPQSGSDKQQDGTPQPGSYQQPDCSTEPGSDKSSEHFTLYSEPETLTINTGSPAKISPILENGGKVIVNGNGTYTATWGYYNRNAFDIRLSDCKICKFTDAASITEPVPFNFPEVFKAGRQQNVFTTNFKGKYPDKLVWTLQGIDGSTSTATAGIPASQAELKGVDLSITKTDNKEVAKRGDLLEYEICIQNDGDEDAENVRIHEILPKGTVFVGSGVEEKEWIPEYPESVSAQSVEARQFYYDVGYLRADGFYRVHFIVKIPDNYNEPGNSIINHAFVDFKGNDADIEDNEATDTTRVTEGTPVEGIDLSIIKTVEQNGKELDYTLTVKNNGDKRADMVRIEERVPSGTEFAYEKSWADKGSWMQPLTIADTGSSSYNRDYYCIVSSIEPHETFAIHFIVNILDDYYKPGNQITNETSVSVLDAEDVDSSNNDYTLVTTLGEEPPVTPPVTTAYVPTYPDLKITETDNDKTVKTGESLEYSIKVENIGQNAASNTKIIETLPEGTSFDGSRNTGWKLENGKYVYDAGTLYVGRKMDVKFTVKVNDTFQGDKIVNNVEVKCLESDQNPANNTAREETPVDSAKPDIEVTKQASSDNYEPGDNVEYMITVKNIGIDDAKDVKVYETLPENMAYGENYSGWTLSDGKYVYEIGDLKVGEAKEIKFYAKVGDSVPEGFSTIDSTVKALDDGRDTNLANNEYTSRINVFNIEAADAEPLGDLPETGENSGDGVAAAGLMLLLTGIVLKARRL